MIQQKQDFINSSKFIKKEKFKYNIEVFRPFAMTLEIWLRWLPFLLIIFEMFLLDWSPLVVNQLIGHDLERRTPVYIRSHS